MAVLHARSERGCRVPRGDSAPVVPLPSQDAEREHVQRAASARAAERAMRASLSIVAPGPGTHPLSPSPHAGVPKAPATCWRFHEKAPGRGLRCGSPLIWPVLSPDLGGNMDADSAGLARGGSEGVQGGDTALGRYPQGSATSALTAGAQPHGAGAASPGLRRGSTE